MDEAAVTQYILQTFADVHVETSADASFFLYDPERKFPFATLVSSDAYDNFSNLERPSVFRLNIGISKQTFQSLFGARSSPSSTEDAGSSQYDFTALNQLMPHPVYGKMYWVCILSPSKETFETVVQPLLAEAYNLDVSKHARRAARR